MKASSIKQLERAEAAAIKLVAALDKFYDMLDRDNDRTYIEHCHTSVRVTEVLHGICQRVRYESENITSLLDSIKELEEQ